MKLIQLCVVQKSLQLHSKLTTQIIFSSIGAFFQLGSLEKSFSSHAAEGPFIVARNMRKLSTVKVPSASDIHSSILPFATFRWFNYSPAPWHQTCVIIQLFSTLFLYSSCHISNYMFISVIITWRNTRKTKRNSCWNAARDDWSQLGGNSCNNIQTFIKFQLSQNLNLLPKCYNEVFFVFTQIFSKNNILIFNEGLSDENMSERERKFRTVFLFSW